MRFLPISILLLFFGCTPYPKKLGYSKAPLTVFEATNPYFANVEKDYVYKARIKAFKKEFGGILVIKKIAPKEHRIVFTTELGNTIFDFSFLESGFKVNRIIKALDRNILISILKKDFLALIHEKGTAKVNFQNDNGLIVSTKIDSKLHYYEYKNDTLNKITRVGNQKEKVLFTFSKISDNIVNNIEIQHKNLALNISLTAF
ncbi:hypothetical protein ACOCEA_02920 [Maribacter sp. CXY002]|uniref:hypothetical protein n=1 Tax=Maribacter luteocoastalis TaxID=3407671 RepID=UPI003B6700B1